MRTLSFVDHRLVSGAGNTFSGAALTGAVAGGAVTGGLAGAATGGVGALPGALGGAALAGAGYTANQLVQGFIMASRGQQEQTSVLSKSLMDF